MAGRLALGTECLSSDDDPEVGLARLDAAGHGGMVGVEVGVVEDVETAGLEGGELQKKGRGCTVRR